MKRMNLDNSIRAALLLLLIIVICSASFAKTRHTDWKRKEVDCRMTGGSRIKAIRYPEHKKPVLFSEKAYSHTKVSCKEIIPKRLLSTKSKLDLLSQQTVSANIINSPPVDGFVPLIVVTATDERSNDEDWVAQTHNSVVGRYLTDDPETNFTIGLFDTGASTHIISNAGAVRTGIFSSNLITRNIIEIAGATSSVFGKVSQPLGVFIDGLAAIDQDTMTLDDSNMVGQSNVSVVIGDPAANEPDLPTVIGTPLSVYSVTVISPEHPISVIYDGNNYTSPDIQFYDHFDSRIPDYSNKVPLNLIPVGATDVQYFPDYEAILSFIFQPGIPSNIGSFLQSLFFINSIDLYNGTTSAIDRNRFMLDTGAQITVLGTNVGSRLGLNPNNPDFEVEIQDVTGAITNEPGFYIDSVEIPVLGQWLRFSNVPVIMLDVSSPEGGFLDGIIGMNLFVYHNLVLHGGGLIGQDAPFLEFELIPSLLTADIVPDSGDGVVDFQDLAAFSRAWLANTESSNWNPKADLAPQTPDGVIDFHDLAVLARQWHDSINP